MARVAANLLVILLLVAFSFLLVSWDATATSGSRALLHASHELQAVDDMNQIKSAKNKEEEEKEFVNNKNGFLSGDYPPNGDNNRHLPPKPPPEGH